MKISNTSSVMVQFLLIAHIAAGFSALCIGLVPMFSKKGSRLHTRAGLIFYWCMMVVAASAVGIAVLKPVSIFRLFLTGIAIFSFYLCFTGRRALRQREGMAILWQDWAVAGLMGITALAMIGYGFVLTYNDLQANRFQSIPVLFLVFGIFSLLNVWTDIRKYQRPELARFGKREWFFTHIIRMSGSYIATFTAFAVVNSVRIPDLPAVGFIVVWVGPGLIGGLLISRTVRFYLAK